MEIDPQPSSSGCASCLPFPRRPRRRRRSSRLRFNTPAQQPQCRSLPAFPSLEFVQDFERTIKGLDCSSAHINQKQCQHLQETIISGSSKLIEVFHSSAATDISALVVEELWRTLRLAGSLVEDCCHLPWSCRPFTRIDNRESFFQLFLDLKWMIVVLRDVVNRAASSKVGCKDDSKLFSILNSYDLGEFGDQTNAEIDRKNILSEVEMLLLKKTASRNVPRFVDTQASSTLNEHALAELLSQRLRDESGKEAKGMLPDYFWVKAEDILTGYFLGEGSYGKVYIVTCRGETYAAKVLHPEYFKREAAVLCRLQHPNIVQLVWCSEDKRNNNCSLVMELMGDNLENVLSGGNDGQPAMGFSIPVAVDIMLQIARGMRYLHSKSVIHRDLKCANVMVVRGSGATSTPAPDNVVMSKDKFLRVKVGDFGMANTKARSAKFSTPKAGSPNWMAPEVFGTLQQADDQITNKYTLKADVYSFAMTCYELLTGEMPFGDMLNSSRLYPTISSGLRPSLPTSCPPYLATYLKRCWDGYDAARPSFSEICRMLSHLKGLLIRTLPSDTSMFTSLKEEDAGEIVRHLGIDETLRLPDFPVQVLVSWLKKIEEEEESGALVKSTGGQKCLDETCTLESGWELRVGDFFANWVGRAHSFEESFFWYRKAAEKGYPEGMWRLGLCYELGLGVEKDNEKAAKLYLDATKRCYVCAFVELGRCFQSGTGVEQSGRKAAEYWDLALAIQEDSGGCVKCIRELVEAVIQPPSSGELEDHAGNENIVHQYLQLQANIEIDRPVFDAASRLDELASHHDSGRQLVSGPNCANIKLFVEALGGRKVGQSEKVRIIKILQKVGLNREVHAAIVEVGGIGEIVRFFKWNGIAREEWCYDLLEALQSLVRDEEQAKQQAMEAEIMSALLVCGDAGRRVAIELIRSIHPNYGGDPINTKLKP